MYRCVAAAGLVLAAWVIPSPAAAQLAELAGTTPDERAAYQTHFMEEELHLTVEQVRLVSQLNLRMANEVEPVLHGDGLAFVKLAKIRSLQQKKERELEQVLSSEQYERYESLRGELRSGLRAHLAEARSRGADGRAASGSPEPDGVDAALGSH